MKAMKILLYRFIPAAAAVLLLAGCTQLLQNTGGTASSGTDGYSTIKLVLAPEENTPAVSESVSSTALVRSAYPSSLDSSMLYNVTALESGASSSIDCTVSVTDAVLSFSLLSGKTWTITVTAYGSSDTTHTTPLLTGTAEVTLSTNQTSASQTVSLLPADGTTSTGTISLQMTDGTTAKTISSITAKYTVAGAMYTTALTGSSSVGWTFSHGTEGTAADASIAAGTYDVVFYFYDSGSALVGWYADKIAVYPGLTTDKWYVSGSTGSDTLSVTDSMLSTPDSNTYFVSGTGGAFTGSDSNSGTVISEPFATLSAALSAVNDVNDGISAYKIYLDGTLTETEQTADNVGLGYCERIYPGKNLTLSIIGIGGAAVLDASAVSGSNLITLLSVTSGTDNYTVNFTLKDLTLKCPPGTSDGEAYGVFAQSYYGSGSLLTLSDCTVEADSEYARPVCILPSENSYIPLTLTGKTALNASGSSLVALRSYGAVTLDSTDISITGVLQAGSIVVNAVPSASITVEPYSSAATSAVTLFSGDSTQSVSGNISSFPLWDTTNYYYTGSCDVMPVQTFSWNGSSNVSATITYAGTSYDVFTADNSVIDGYFCTAVDSNGQIYVMYYSSTFTVYTAGESYSVDVGSCDLNCCSGSMCVLTDGSLLFARSSYSNTLCELTLSGGTYSCTDVTLTDSDNTDGPCITSLAAEENNSTQYVFYTYTDTSSEPCIPKLACAVLSSTALTKEWAESVSISDVYCSMVSIKDMTVGFDGNLYMLLSDKSTVDFILNNSLYLTYRGALVCAGSAQSLASDTAPSSLSLTSYGWRSSSNGTTQCTASGYESSAISIYASSSDSYTDDQYLTGPVRFLGLTLKQITMADYGIYVNGTSYNTKSGTAVFTLDAGTLDLAATDSGVYGEYISGTISTYSSSYQPMN
jgi:hypothetical protein